MTTMGMRLRLHTPAECDTSGYIRGWKRCTNCDARGKTGMTTAEADRWADPLGGDPFCTVCGGHGSVEAQVLAQLCFDPENVTHVRPWDCAEANLAILCERCWAAECARVM